MPEIRADSRPLLAQSASADSIWPRFVAQWLLAVTRWRDRCAGPEPDHRDRASQFSVQRIIRRFDRSSASASLRLVSTQPDDLSVLARLTVLESIAMLADIHADMPGNLTGYRSRRTDQTALGCDRRIRESVSSTPLDTTTLARAQEKIQRGRKRLSASSNRHWASSRPVGSCVGSSARSHSTDRRDQFGDASGESELLAAVPLPTKAARRTWRAWNASSTARK